MKHDEIPKSLQNRINELELSSDICEDKSVRNIYMAIKIVDEYFKDYKKEDDSYITEEERKIIVEQILDSKCLNKKRGSYLSTLAEKLKNVGLDEKEQYGFIIRLAVEKSNGIDTYSNFLKGGFKLPEDMTIFKEKSEVNDVIIKKAKDRAEKIMKKALKQKKKKSELLDVEKTYAELQRLQEIQKENNENLPTMNN